MYLSSLKCAFRELIAIGLLLIFPLSLWAQEAQSAAAQNQNSAAPQTTQSALPQAPASNQKQFVVTDYSKPKRAFPNVLAPYTARDVPAPILSNTGRIDQLTVRHGRTVQHQASGGMDRVQGPLHRDL